MTLSLSLDVATSSLGATADQTAVVSRNVARAGDPGASRKTANLITVPGYGVRLASITRVTDAALFNNMLDATSSVAAQTAIVEALDRLDQTINDPELDASPAALIAKFVDALYQYAAGPQDAVRGQSAVAAARDLADGLNSATVAVQKVRAEADAAIGASVNNLNTLLARFETVNSQIVAGTRTGNDVTDYLDTRDQLLASISEEVGVRTVTRGDNDMAVYTDSGVTLFDVRARPVTFDRTLIYSATTVGNPIYADGVPIAGGTGGMPTGSGRLTGLVAIRDSVAVTYQSQLDEMARGLIEAFAESDQSAVPALPDVPGLFTYAGAPALPASGTILPGLAGTIRVSASVDPAQGGNAALLRDGGISGNPAYIYNASGAAGFQDHLLQLASGLSEARSFDPASQLAATSTLTGFGSSSVGWLQDLRKSANDDVAYKTTLVERSSEALSKVTGVNIDEEMTLLLELERSYQASSKLISTINSMFNSLLAIAG